MTPLDSDPCLHLPGGWRTLTDAEQSLVRAAVARDVAPRADAWERLAAGPPLPLALALDWALALVNVRFGSPVAIDDATLRRSALRLLEHPPVGAEAAPGGRAEPTGSHAVALLALGQVGSPDDARVVAQHAPPLGAPEGSLRAWLEAVDRLLSQDAEGLSGRFIGHVAACAQDASLDADTRSTAVRVLGLAHHPSAEGALRVALERPPVRVQVEAAVGLTSRGPVDEPSRRFILDLLDRNRQETAVLVHGPQLLAALRCPGA